MVSGFGTARDHEGNKYKGDFLHLTMHGDGTMHCANGDVYVGQFENGQFHGQGKFITYFSNILQCMLFFNATHNPFSTFNILYLCALYSLIRFVTFLNNRQIDT